MSKHPPVHLIRQFELQASVERLAQHAAPVAKMLAGAGLPAQTGQPGRGFVPGRRMLKFFADGSRYMEQEDFAFRAALRAPESSLGSWGDRVCRCWRLRDALHYFVAKLEGDVSFLESGIHFGEDHVWVWRRRFLPEKDPLGERQGEQHTLASMVRVVREAAGPSWYPPEIRAESPASDWLLRAESLGGSSVCFGGDTIAIAVPYELIDLRLPHGKPANSIPPADELPTAAIDLAGSLQQALAPLVGTEHMSMELAAEIAESSPRTLRRRLDEEGTSFRGILNRILFEAAEERMKEPTLSLAEISGELGYANEANFSRAFRCWTGETPSAYRRHRQVH